MNQYELLAPFQNENAGFSRWTFAKKEGKEYFLKEFLDPVYPTDQSISLELRNQRIYDCVQYEANQIKLYEAVNKASHGNIVRVVEFFRYDNHYYVTMDKVEEKKISISEMPEIPFKNRFLLCKTIAFEMMNLHREHIVHADIKDKNILIKETPDGGLAGKIIDFDASFFEDTPPALEDELGGDQVYLAPEACQFICGDSVELTCKVDVFALGVLFHQYLTGKIPEFDRNEYDYAFEAVLDGQSLELDEGLSPELQTLIQEMLKCSPEERISMEEVYTSLDRMDIDLKAEKKKSEKESTSGWFQTAGDL